MSGWILLKTLTSRTALGLFNKKSVRKCFNIIHNEKQAVRKNVFWLPKQCCVFTFRLDEPRLRNADHASSFFFYEMSKLCDRLVSL